MRGTKEKPMTKEQEMCAEILCGHLKSMEMKLRKLSAEHWDWTPAPAAPTSRTLATHAWQWLICDRQHINEADVLKHSNIPEPPADPVRMCDALAIETENWRKLITEFPEERWEEPRKQFGNYEMTVRKFVYHMIQNTIYKNGQFSTLYYALGYDGDELYSAPFPNPIYDQVRQMAETSQKTGETPASP